MWTYRQSTGELFHDGRHIATGYSGYHQGKNNPAMQGVAGTGPIPRGRWRMVDIYDSRKVGPHAIVLHKLDSHDDDFDEETGRSAFRIHGDSIRAPGTASHGCIIMPRATRLDMWQGGDHALEVVE